MSKNEFLKQIEVKNHCPQEWDEMTGNDEIRFCGHCNSNVNNLSAMTRKKALKIVRESQGGICVRYVQNPVDKTPVFADRFYQITRRAGIAAGVLGASLSLSSLTYAQGELRPRLINNETEISQTEQTDEDKTESAAASVSGTIIDSQGNFAFGVSVTLTNLKSNEIFYAETNGDGFYEFKDVAAGTYRLAVLNEKGNAQVESLEIAASSENRQDLALTLPVVNDEIISELPEGVNFVTMGMIAITIVYDNPLSLAVSNDDIEEVKNLIAKGADVNGREKNSKNTTPLFLAVENGNAEVAETLLNFGAKINARDNEKQTPLMRLDEDASAELVRLLIKHGAKVNLTDKEGNTALILAVEYGRTEVFQELINNGADVNAQNNEGETALMRAANDDDLEKVKILLIAGADVNLKNKEGETAWEQTGDETVEKILESYGAVKTEN
ncbi:hypothetical protein BH20ACI4_BH20ACI4_01860 [soil metagenome]